MQITTPHAQSPGHSHAPTAAYRERLSPSLWTLVTAAVVAPMAALVFAPLDSTLALVAGAIAGIGLVSFLMVVSPVVTVEDGVLRAGRAHIPVDLLGVAVAHSAEPARAARGPELDPRGWHLIRGGVDGLVVVPVNDPDDPVSVWTISSRTPDRLAAAITRAQLKPRTPGK